MEIYRTLIKSDDNKFNDAIGASSKNFSEVGCAEDIQKYNVTDLEIRIPVLNKDAIEVIENIAKLANNIFGRNAVKLTIHEKLSWTKESDLYAFSDLKNILTNIGNRSRNLFPIINIEPNYKDGKYLYGKLYGSDRVAITGAVKGNGYLSTEILGYDKFEDTFGFRAEDNTTRGNMFLLMPSVSIENVIDIEVSTNSGYKSQIIYQLFRYVAGINFSEHEPADIGDYANVGEFKQITNILMKNIKLSGFTYKALKDTFESSEYATIDDYYRIGEDWMGKLSLPDTAEDLFTQLKAAEDESIFYCDTDDFADAEDGFVTLSQILAE